MELPLTDWQTVDLDYAMKNVLAELFTFAAPPAVVSDSPQRKLLLLPCGEVPERTAIEEQGRRFFDAIGRYFKAQACFYVGTPAPLEGLARQHRLLSALERQNISYSGQVFFSGQDRSAPTQTEAAPLERWQRLLERLDADALCREVHSWLLRQVERRSMNARTLELFYHDFLQMLYTVLAQHNISAAQLLRDQDLDTARILSSLESTEAQLAHMVRRSCAYLEDMRQENILVERVKAYIDQHLTEDLSRDLLAGVVFLNPNYLSRLFHQETGSSLVDYITQRRVAQVKHLLRTTSLSVTEAAGQLGYTNMPYFSRVFKKEAGCSPVEFRRSLRPGK